MDQLPDELLCTIFEHPDVPVESLFNMSLTCRNMHYFTLPIFLSRFGIRNPQNHCDVTFSDRPPGSLDALSGLRIALFIPSINELVVRFKHTPHPTDYLMVIRDMRRVRDFVSNLKKVSIASFVMGSENCACCSSVLVGAEKDAALEEWSTTIGTTWSKIIEKKCYSITISGGKYMGHTYSFKAGRQHIINPKRSFMGLKRALSRKRSDVGLRREDDKIDILRGDNWSFVRASETGRAIVLTQLQETAKAHAVLRQLSINSTILMVPPLLHWVISVLRLPTVYFLQMKDLSINWKCWDALFTLIAKHAPHLTEIHLSFLRQILPTELTRFISQFPGLMSLHLGPGIDVVDSYDIVSLPDFPRLRTLLAPSSWVFKLLSSNRKGLASLEELIIVYNMTKDGLSYWVHRSTGLPSIPALLKEQQRSLTIQLIINLGNKPGRAMSENFGAIAQLGAFDQPELGDISSVIFIADAAISEYDVPLSHVLAKWLSIFFGLRSLSFRTQGLSEAQTKKIERSLFKDMGKILKAGELAEIASVRINDYVVTADKIQRLRAEKGVVA